MSGYVLTAHTADVGLAATGETFAELLANCGLGLRAVTFGDLRVPATRHVAVQVEADDLAELLVAWLSELLAVAEIEGLAIVSVGVDEATGLRVRGEFGGVPHDAVEMLGPPVKAITYHGLEVHDHGDHWAAEVILDV